MKKILTMLLMVCLIILFAEFSLCKSDPFPATTIIIHIRSDGTIDPPTSPITVANGKYYLTDNLPSIKNSDFNITVFSISVEKNNIVLDGANHYINGSDRIDGIQILNGNNVTIQNIILSGFFTGVEVVFSNNINVFNNSVSGNIYGFSVMNSSNIVLRNNYLDCYQTAIEMQHCNSSIIYGNDLFCTPMTGNYAIGLSLERCPNNYIVANTITNYPNGIFFVNSSNNYFYQNNIMCSRIQAQDLMTTSYQKVNGTSWHGLLYFSTNTWINNYWSNYNGSSDSNGVGESPYVIDERNIDNSPLTKKVTLEQAVPFSSINFEGANPSIPNTTANPTPTPAVPESSFLTIPLLLAIMVVAGLLVYFKKHRRSLFAV